MNMQSKINAPPDLLPDVLEAFLAKPSRETELFGALSRLIQTVNIAIEGGNPSVDILMQGADEARAVLWRRA